MSDTTVTCPDCEGKGVLDAMVNRGKEVGCKWESITCITCHGRKCIGADFEARKEEGRKLRSERIGRDETLFQAAVRYNMTVVEYSRLERGLEPTDD